MMKSSKWSLEFLNKWWTVVDRLSGMDQHVFDLLWKKDDLHVRGHTALLAPDAVNSAMPASKFQVRL